MFCGKLFGLKYLQCYSWIKLKFVLFMTFGLLDSECIPYYVLLRFNQYGNTIIWQLLSGNLNFCHYDSSVARI